MKEVKQHPIKQHLNKLVFGLILGVAVFVGLGIYADFREMFSLLQSFQWEWLPLILLLTSLNYALRFAKWHYYTREIGIKQISVADNLRIYFGGFGLSLTPGKAGELIRTLWFQNLAGVHPAKTAPMVFAERLSDGLAMAILSLLGGLVYPQYWLAVIFIASIMVLAIIIIQIRPLALWCLNLGEMLPVVANVVHHLHQLYESAYQLLRFKPLLIAVSLGCVAWISQGVAFYVVLWALNVTASSYLLFLAIFIVSSSAILGGASGLPGGLAVTEGSLTGMLLVLVHLPQNLAATATLIIRFCTLWFGVTLGLLTIAIWHKRLFNKANGPINKMEEDVQLKNEL